MDTLLSIGISEENYDTALENLTSGFHRETVSVWAMASTPAEYFNLITHELHHLSVQIAACNDMDLEGEDVCYLNGDIAQYLYPLCRPLIT